MIKTLSFHLFIFLFGVSTTFSQSPRQIKKANQLLSDQRFEEALVSWKKIQSENPKNANFNFKLGLCYFKSFDKGYKSLEYFRKAVKKTSANYDFFNTKETNAPLDAWFFLAEAYMLNNKPDSALQYYFEFMKTSGSSTLLPIEQRLTLCLNAIKLKQELYKNQLLKALVVNGLEAEINPVVSWDESLMFMAVRKLKNDSSNLGKYDFDIYISQFNNDWEKPKFLSISTEYDEFPLFVSRDGKTLYFSRKDKKDFNLYKTVLQNNIWLSPEPLFINSEADENGFTMSLDEKTIYFSSNRRGGKGGFDIYYCKKNGDIWEKPVNVSDLNTTNDEINPFLAPDSKTLFFSSNGMIESNMGGFDLWFSNIDGSNKCIKPSNIGFPINTSADDLFLSRSASDNIVYICRIDQANSFDLYSVQGFELNEYAKKTNDKDEESNDLDNDPEIKNIVKQINEKNNEADVLDLIRGLEPHKAAMVIQHLDKETTTRIFYALESDKSSQIMGFLKIEKVIEITDGLPAEKSIPIIQSLDLEKSVSVIEAIDVNKAARITEGLDISKAAKVMEGIAVNTSSSIIGSMDIEKAVGVVDAIETDKAADILENVEIEKAIDVVEKIGTEKAVDIVKDIDSEKAGDIIGSMEIEKAVGLMEGMPVEKAVTVMESFDKEKSVAVVSAMNNESAANIIEKMDLPKAVSVMEGIPQEKAVGFIQGMEVEKAVDLMSGMESEKSEAIVEDLQKQVDTEGSNSKVVTLLKKFFAGQISNKESIIFKTIYFDFNSSELLLLSKNELMMLIDFLKENRIVKVEVVGHTDNIGDWDSNLKVSGDRAKVVYDFLRSGKVEHDRIIFYGKGPASPISLNDTDYGRKLNRRVEIILLQ